MCPLNFLKIILSRDLIERLKLAQDRQFFFFFKYAFFFFLFICVCCLYVFMCQRPRPFATSFCLRFLMCFDFVFFLCVSNLDFFMYRVFCLLFYHIFPTKFFSISHFVFVKFEKKKNYFYILRFDFIYLFGLSELRFLFHLRQAYILAPRFRPKSSIKIFSSFLFFCVEIFRYVFLYTFSRGFDRSRFEKFHFNLFYLIFYCLPHATTQRLSTLCSSFYLFSPNFDRSGTDF